MDIIEGKYSLAAAKSKMQEFEAKYGRDFFGDYEVEKKNTAWDSDYLNDLKIKCMAGMTSKQFVLHVAEVSEYVNSQKKEKNKLKKYIRVGIAVLAAAAIVALLFIFCLLRNLYLINNTILSLPI